MLALTSAASSYKNNNWCRHRRLPKCNGFLACSRSDRQGASHSKFHHVFLVDKDNSSAVGNGNLVVGVCQ